MSIAGYVGAFATLLFGTFVAKKGSRLVSGICIIICGVLFLLWAYAKTIGVFLAATIVMTALAYRFQTASGPVLISSWFPRKKGIVLGWATMVSFVLTSHGLVIM